MARTPLFRTLERSLRLARLAAATGRSAAELADEGTEVLAAGRRRARDLAAGGLSRRAFLRATALAATGAAVTGCRTLRSAGGGPEVLIVGAGIAGLTCAHRLKQAGVAVRVVEAQERVGGRMFSLRNHFADGQVAELGGELIDTGHVSIRRLAAELGIPLDDLHAGEEGAETWYFAGRSIAQADVVEAFRPVAARIQADLASLPGEPWATYDEPNGAEALDRTSLAEWLAGCGCEGWFRDLLNVAYTTEYGLETDRQSALNLLFLISPEPDPFHVFGDSDERFHVQGGNDRIPLTLAAGLDEEIRLGRRLEAVRQRADGLYECSLRVSAGGAGRSEVIAAPHLVLALPFTLLRDVRLDVELPAVKRRAIAELGYGTNAKLMMGFARRVWRQGSGPEGRHRVADGSVFTDLPFQLVWETSRKQPGDAGILTNFTGGDHGMAVGEGTAAEQAAGVVADLERVFPGVAAAHAPNFGAAGRDVRFHWPTFPFTRGSYASYQPGQWTAFGGAEGESVGQLHFVGEHCSQEAQGYMEGGCETGERAAREILAALGLAQAAA